LRYRHKKVAETAKLPPGAGVRQRRGAVIAADIASVRRFYPGATEADLAETVKQVEAAEAGKPHSF
jgi:hypothetical protein